MKRNINLIHLSREHHFGLLCSWKVREGVKLGIDYHRIKAYINYFWTAHLSPHFITEDVAFESVNQINALAVMQQEHLEIKQLITLINESENSDLLLQFADALQHHIRFEEREFFTNLEQNLSDLELAEIGLKLQKCVVAKTDDYADEFWNRNPK